MRDPRLPCRRKRERIGVRNRMDGQNQPSGRQMPPHVRRRNGWYRRGKRCRQNRYWQPESQQTRFGCRRRGLFRPGDVVRIGNGNIQGSFDQSLRGNPAPQAQNPPSVFPIRQVMAVRSTPGDCGARKTSTTGRVGLYTPQPPCYAFFPNRHRAPGGRTSLIENLPNVFAICVLRPIAPRDYPPIEERKVVSLREIWQRPVHRLPAAGFGGCTSEKSREADVCDKRGHLA
jgi:hypothetical protein